MPAFHLLRCMVALGGDEGNQVYRDRDRPIVFPELPILQFMHGEEAITDDLCRRHLGDDRTTRCWRGCRRSTSRRRCRRCIPGARPRLPRADGSIPRCTLPIYKPRPTRPDSPDPKLRPLDQFTMDNAERRCWHADQPVEAEPTDDEIAAHAQDDDEADPAQVEALADRAWAWTCRANRPPRSDAGPHHRAGQHQRPRRVHAGPLTQLPDVNAGGSHRPIASRSPAATRPSQRERPVG